MDFDPDANFSFREQKIYFFFLVRRRVRKLGFGKLQTLGLNLNNTPEPNDNMSYPIGLSK